MPTIKKIEWVAYCYGAVSLLLAMGNLSVCQIHRNLEGKHLQVSKKPEVHISAGQQSQEHISKWRIILEAKKHESFKLGTTTENSILKD